MLLRVLAGLGVLVVLVGIVVGLMAAGIIPIPDSVLVRFSGAQPPEHSARYYPPDTMVYVWMTFVPGEEQFSDSKALFERLAEYEPFEDWVDDLRDSFEDETDISFDHDVRPWIGPDISAGLLNVYPDQADFEGAITISVRDGGAALRFMDDWLHYMKRDIDSDFDEDAAGDFEIWLAKNDEQAYALSGDLLVFATSEWALDKMLDHISADEAASLAGTEEFAAARSQLPKRRFMSVFVNTEPLFDEVEGILDDLAGSPITGIGDLEDYIPPWMAMSAGWVEAGITAEMVLLEPGPPSAFSQWASNPAEMLPRDTLSYLAFAFDPDLDNLRETLKEHRLEDYVTDEEEIDEINDQILQLTQEFDLQDPPKLRGSSGLDEVLDLALWAGDQLIGIDFERDFLDYLGGETVLAVSDFHLDSVAEQPDRYPVDVSIALSYREGDERDLASTMDKFVDLIRDELDLDYDYVAVGADRDAAIFSIPETRYEPGYVMFDGQLAFGTTEQSLAGLVAARSGGQPDLQSVSEYRRAMAHLPSQWEFQWYIDLHKIIQQINRDDIGLERSELRLLTETVGSVAINSHVGDGYARASVVLTLFPE